MKTISTLADLLSQDDPSQAAVILPERGLRITHRGLSEQVETLAALLRQTPVQTGRAVVIALPNGLEYLAVFLAVARARLVAAPLNPAYKPDEFRFYLEDIAAHAVIAPPGPHPVRDVARELRSQQSRARLMSRIGRRKAVRGASDGHKRAPGVGKALPIKSVAYTVSWVEPSANHSMPGTLPTL